METLSELDIPVRYGQPKIRLYLNRHGEERSFLYSHCDYQGAPAYGGVPWLSIKQGNGKSGLLSVTGEWIIAPCFDDVRAFNRDGVARVCDGGRWGIVNRAVEYAGASGPDTRPDSLQKRQRFFNSLPGDLSA